MHSGEAFRGVKDVLEAARGVEMAFAFGSRVAGNATDESDLDIAVYFTPVDRPFDLENRISFDGEDVLWARVEKAAKAPVDLVVLNRAPATLADAVLRTGLPLFMRNPSLFRDFFLAASMEAEDFREFAEDFWRIKQRSRSLSRIDRDRLIRLVDFLESEMREYGSFEGLTARTYRTESAARRNAERFVENLVNASIDVAKIVLAAEARPIPQTHGEALEALELLSGFPPLVAGRLAAYAKLRNVLADEYLDRKFDRIDPFLKGSNPAYQALVDWLKARYLS